MNMHDLTLSEVERYGLSIAEYYRASAGVERPVVHSLVRPTPKTFSMAGRHQTLSQWCTEYGKPVKTITARLKAGMSLYVALTRPIRKHRPKGSKHTTGAYQEALPDSTGTGHGWHAKETDHSNAKSKTEKQPAKAGKSTCRS